MEIVITAPKRTSFAKRRPNVGRPPAMYALPHTRNPLQNWVRSTEKILELIMRMLFVSPTDTVPRWSWTAAFPKPTRVRAMLELAR